MSGRSTATHNPLLTEGLDWVSRLAAGRLSPDEREQLARWRARSAAHEAAFQEARALGLVLREVGREVLQDQRRVTMAPQRRPVAVSRRFVIGGAVAASAAGVAVVAGSVDWPTLLGSKPDFATGTGERRTITLARGLTVDLDAQTSIAVHEGSGEHRVHLLGGRAAVNAQLTDGAVVLTAGKGRISAQQARFAVEQDRDRSCVTCVRGLIDVAYDRRRSTVMAGQELVYTRVAFGQAAKVDTQIATAWASGKLIFHHTPLSEVVRQVNRYRPGRIVIGNPSLAGRPVNGVFYIDSMDEAILQIEQVTGARALALPGKTLVLA